MLVAEVVCGELARALGLPVPALVTVDVAPELAVGEPDVEVQELLQRSAGRNLGLDYLPGALDFEAGADGVDPGLAGRVLWFDALVGNVDRSWRNPNMLFWHGRLQLIDHGAALTFHHNWPGAAAAVARPYDAAAHALLECEPDVPAADAALAPRVTRAAARRRARRRCPTSGWRTTTRPSCATRYVDQLLARLAARDAWLPGLVAAAAAGGAGAAARRAGRTGRPGWARRRRKGCTPAMSPRSTFEYAVLRVVPRVERGEALNAGVLVYCRQRDYLGSRVHLDVDRLRALDPTADADAIGRALQAAADICAAEPGAGAAGREALGSRFRWLTAPRSTVVQPGPVHTGLTEDPDAEADRLLRLLVLPVADGL